MDLFVLKNFLHNIINCVVLFSKEQENEAIDFYIRKTKGCFVILDGRDIPKFKKGDVEVSCFGNFDQSSVKDSMSALYYVNVDSEELKNIEEYDEYICQIMDENLKKFELYDICIREHTVILRYKTADCNLELEEKNITIINLLYGIGDFFILSSIYYELIEEHRRQGKKVYLEFFAQEDNTHQRTRNMCELFFYQEASHVCMGCRKLHSMLMRNIDKLRFQVISINAGIRVEHKMPEHIVDIVQKYLWGDKNHVSPYKYRNLIIQRVMSKLQENEKEIINEYFKKYDKVVGIQFYSGKYSVKKREWKDEDVKNWNVQHVLEFCNMCKKEKINLVNLSPNPYMDELSESVHIFPRMSVSGYVYLISKLYYLVGIDSSANHIAALFDVPHITLWWNRLVHRQAYDVNANWCFRSLRNDYSLAPFEDFQLNKMDVGKIFDVFLQAYQGKLEHLKDGDLDIHRMLEEAVQFL